MNIDWILAGSVILSGLAIVFLILVLLIAVVNLTGRIVNRATPEQTASKPSATAVKAPTPSVPPASPAPTVQRDIEEETVAAISAAVYACMDACAPGVPFEITSISRATGGRPVWGFAGMQQNTRPF